MSDGGIGLTTLDDLVEVGRGGFATVYRARQARFGRTVAVKLLDPQGDPRSIERFERECEAMGMLSSHPNIVTIFDAGLTEDGKPYLIMEYMPDGSLDDRLEREGSLPWDEVADIGVKLAGALETAHEAGILHRDVKPANVLRSSFGEPCLSDFGLARFGSNAKTTGVVTATILHAPPEILSGEAATARSDVYSLASTLYTLVVGEAPFWLPTDESILPLLGRIADDPVPDLRARGLPDELCSAIEAGMAKEPTDRPLSARAFAALLQATQRSAGHNPTRLPVSAKESVDAARTIVRRARSGGPGPAVDGERTIAGAPALPPTPHSIPDGERPPRRRRRWAAVATVAVLALLAGAAVVLLGGDGGGGGTTADGGGTTADDGRPPTDTSLPSPRVAAAELVGDINEYRTAQGLPVLEVDPVLAREARDQALVVAREGRPRDVDLQAVGDRHDRWGTLVINSTGGGSVAEAHAATLANEDQVMNLNRRDVNVVGVGVSYNEDHTGLWVVEYLAGTLA